MCAGGKNIGKGLSTLLVSLANIVDGVAIPSVSSHHPPSSCGLILAGQWCGLHHSVAEYLILHSAQLIPSSHPSSLGLQ